MADDRLTLRTPWIDKWQPEFIGTLLFLLDDAGRVLLIHKKTGHGAGRVNGPGGKLDPDESIVTCACREVFEEVGLTVQDARVGLEMRFVERDGPQWLGFALTATEYAGQPVESKEATPFWCPIDEVPYEEMWPDDAIWLPKLLAGEFVEPAVGNFLFEDERLLAHQFDNQAQSIWRQFGA